MKKIQSRKSELLQEAYTRRKFVTGAVAGGALLGLNSSSIWAQVSPELTPRTLTGKEFDLSIDYKAVNFTGQEGIATAINGSVPAPILRWRDGDEITLRVSNNLAVDSSIHWHGIILPANMDGVPGMSFDGIKPGETFEYQFTLNQSGTYWYHSHSGYQEQTGMYGAIVIDPKESDPVSYDREYVVVLSDWSDTSPERIYSKLKKMSHYYNFNERTVGDLWQDIKDKGIAQTWNDRAMWNQMRMSDRDIADVTGYTYTYLMNGNAPDQNWQAIFQAGEKVRLRFINAGAMTIFDVRMPGLEMTVVAADGQNIEPVTIDEFRIASAETYDVIVEPSANTAYTIFAQSIDRSGYARGTLTPQAGLSAAVPAMDTRAILGHADMGMDMSGMDMEGMDHSQMDMSGMNMESMDHSEMDRSQMDMSGMNMESMDHSEMDHSQMDMSGMNMESMDHSQMDHSQMDMPMQSSIGRAGFGSSNDITHVRSEFGPQVDMRSQNPQNGLNDPGIGLRNHQQLYNRRVLNYGDIKSLYPTLDTREPEREIELHLTGNMSRYMWSMNGIKFADAEPLDLRYGERVRITLINDTMMTHPIHLHGMWSELETGDPQRLPRKHTIIVQPGSKISYLVTADARGSWAYHCHLLYHMMGMFREVRVS
ncbi:copper resistance system multicopper oxidase [Gammaproteobacteria bacterium]|nr:copper resistance system multicopper oxidase [Gammaproteobacteria bacterium]